MTCPELPAASDRAPEFPFRSSRLRNIQREGWAEFVQQLVGGDVPGCLHSPGSRRLAMPPGQSRFVSLLIAAWRKEGGTCSVSSLGAISNADMKKMPGSLYLGREPGLPCVQPARESLAKSPSPENPGGRGNLLGRLCVSLCAERVSG